MIIRTTSEPLRSTGVSPVKTGRMPVVRSKEFAMGMESQVNEQPSEQALLELGFGPDPPAEVLADELTDQAALEADIEANPALIPAGASALLVAPAMLDPQEVEALLSGLHSLLEEASAAAAVNALAADALIDQQKDSGYEPDSPATGRDRRHP